MGANINQIEGATEIERYFRNCFYATALSDMNNLQEAYFTDIDRCGYKGWSETPKAGSMHKFMEDASGATNIPGESVLFADSNGRATFDADFTFDGTDLTINGAKAITILSRPSAGDDEIPFSHNWSFLFTADHIEIANGGTGTGVFLI